MTLNLDAPPGFRGLDPDKPLKMYTRNLPHWRQDGATYFVTFNLADALPGPKKEELKSMRREWEHRNPPPRDEATWTQYAKSVFVKVEKWMDAGYGQCWFRRACYAKELWRSILHYHTQRYQVGCFTIMGNHCHLVMRPFAQIELEQEVGSIKSVTARFIGKREQRKGPLWQQEAYDRIIRDDEHLYRVVQYIGANPGRAGIPPNEWHRWINPEWKAAGWDFNDQ
ncbi:Transposase IS200 like protein [Rubripirellula obstinata]|uniref:Transposase IS200 like protein n=1 Tax=Rubripirellula obstinata TaxID=406547 RepID=A0A5B1CSE7_9BACT|nr:transposase [Rubripirellula obstinata]KAA1262313.1 Transposase IS200 like protein [Rubripirellula obstinata]